MKNKMYLTEEEQIERYNAAVKTNRLVAEITSKYTSTDWANVAIYGADLTAEQIAKAEGDSPFIHRDALRDEIIRECRFLRCRASHSEGGQVDDHEDQKARRCRARV